MLNSLAYLEKLLYLCTAKQLNTMKKLSTLLFVLVASINLWATEGALSGKFTINAQGDKIVFSQGNLRATTSDLGEHWTWSFAEHQYDYIGDNAPNYSINGNGTVSSNGTLDLFGWSAAPTYYGIVTSNYSGAFVDWGSNAITNGGNEANLWRTLTIDEWVYLFYTRENAATLFGMGSVNDVNGTILLPDNWVLPTGASFTASTTQGLADQGSYYFNSNGDNFSHNAYTTEQWEVMESAGAVFLPAAGYRFYSIESVNSYGYYWSATPASYTYYACYIYFDSYNLNPQADNDRQYGFSVRLVQAAPNGGATAINTANADANATKRIVNGQLLIEKNGIRYNALGAEVK